VKARLDISALPRIDAAVDESRLSEQASNQRPTVFFMPGLTARALWINNRDVQSTSASSVSMAVVAQTVRPLLKEMDLTNEEIADFVYQCAAHGDMAGWRANDTERGNWDVFPLVSQGHVFEENVARLPHTWRALQLIDGVACGVGARRSCFGNVFVSVLSPDTAISAHCGPTNVRLRMHVPIRVPDDAASSLRVDGELVRWENGTWLLFDDSFEHAARNDSKTDDRIALIVDLWHPELTGEEREAIIEMFNAI
jgi:aspartyl/asparaginyl beta-hydroxylase (cupin superfamily)